MKRSFGVASFELRRKDLPGSAELEDSSPISRKKSRLAYRLGPRVPYRRSGGSGLVRSEMEDSFTSSPNSSITPSRKLSHDDSGYDADLSVMASPDLGLMQSPRRKFSTKDIEECKTCSCNVFEVCHPHITTVNASSRGGQNFCNTCRTKHSSHSTGSRRSLVLGSSTLHNVWKVGTYRPKFHVDFDIIIGGCIHDVHNSFLVQFEPLTEPMDIILACGVNNIPTNDSAETIIFQFRSFVESIKRHSIENRFSRPSKVVISTILYAPKYCDKRLPEHLNMLEKVRKVNKWIEEFNSKNTGKHLRLHLHGVKGDPSIGETVEHQYEDWKEPDRGKKLHLNQEVKAQIAKDLLKIFDSLRDDHDYYYQPHIL